jgi:23S rRNA (uracil1939-C5)-methyltransferase
MTTGHLELSVTGVAAGGDGIARTEAGKVVFVEGALPGERVRVRLDGEKRDYARGVVDTILEPSPDRATPPCEFVAAGCGGCDLQHVTPQGQRALKVSIVRDALRRIGRIEEAEVDAGPDLASTGYRTTVRGVSDGGRFALRRRHSHDPVAVDACLVAHPLLADLIADGRFPDGADVTLRCGARTGERLVLVQPKSEGTGVPEGVTVVGGDELRGGHRAWFHEEVAGRTWRVSAHSFFQGRADGADALVDAARAAADGVLGGDRRLVDLYAGVGLFAGALGTDMHVEAVEHSASAVADARVNLPHDGVRVLRLAVDKWRPSAADLVIADPPRTGLGKAIVAKIAATNAERLVLVSCDPAALGRDARLLSEAGYDLARSTLIDLFPHTSHVEVVSRFDRTRATQVTTG